MIDPTLRRRLNLFMGLNFLAVLDTAYLVFVHFKPSASEFCTINGYLNCDVVNKSVYAELFGIPVAVLGLLTYLALIGMAFLYKRSGNQNLLWALFGLVTTGLAFSLYLTYVEFFVLYAVCIFCLVQQVIILVDFALIGSILKRTETSKPLSS